MRRIWWLNAAAVLLITAGVTLALTGHNTLRWSPPPLPPTWAARQSALTAVPQFLTGRQQPMRRSVPVSIAIPSIQVHAFVISLGLNRDGSIAAPPLTNPMVTSWYDQGPTPGESGAAAILGHVDAAKVGPAVFYRLGDMRPGDRILVQLRDGHTAVFETYAVAVFSKAKFPTDRIYGSTSWPTLRLITCGGVFDPRSGHYLGNIVAFASYIGSRR